MDICDLAVGLLNKNDINGILLLKMKTWFLVPKTSLGFNYFIQYFNFTVRSPIWIPSVPNPKAPWYNLGLPAVNETFIWHDYVIM